MKIAKDKQLHLIAGAAVAVATVVAGFGVYAAATAALAGVAKEVYDYFTPGRVVDKWDAVYTAVPGIPITAYFLLV